jgi:urease accessory protein
VLAAAVLDNFVGSSNSAAGAGELRVARAGAKSVVARARATSPLKLLMPQNHGRAAWVFTSTYGGGLVDGDAVALDVEIGEGAAAWLSTQASTKVYRSPRGVSSVLRARVMAGAALVVVPDPVVCFAGSTYRQSQQFDLAPDAGLVCVDWMTSGRRARGERWAFDEYRARLVVRVAETVLCYDAVTLAASDGPLADRFDRFDVLATAVIAGPSFGGEAGALVADRARCALERRADTVVSASPLGDGGALIRIAGRSVEDVGRVLRHSLAFLPSVFGDDPLSRKW